MDSYKKMFRIMEDNHYSAYVGSVNYKNEKVRRGAKHDTVEIFKKMKAIVSGCEGCEEKNYILCLNWIREHFCLNRLHLQME